MILDKEKRTVFLSSGPVMANSPLKSEWLGLELILEVFAKSSLKARWLIIYSDCSNLICKYLQVIALKENEERLFLTTQNLRIKVKLISRDLNMHADRLAKEGAFRSRIVQLWTSIQSS